MHVQSINELKSYIVFCYADFYPAGGMNDFIASFDSEEEAIQFTLEKMKEGGLGMNILDTVNGKVIYL
jgi:hypothetical protein